MTGIGGGGRSPCLPSGRVTRPLGSQSARARSRRARSTLSRIAVLIFRASESPSSSREPGRGRWRARSAARAGARPKPRRAWRGEAPGTGRIALAVASEPAATTSVGGDRRTRRRAGGPRRKRDRGCPVRRVAAQRLCEMRLERGALGLDSVRQDAPLDEQRLLAQGEGSSPRRPRRARGPKALRSSPTATARSCRGVCGAARRRALERQGSRASRATGWPAGSAYQAISRSSPRRVITGSANNEAVSRPTASTRYARRS